MTFAPDCPLVRRIHASPNFELRRSGFKPDLLLLHYTGLPTVERAIDVLSRSDCKVSCHYVLGLDGTVTQMVPETQRAWHAGVAFWSGVTDINSCSIGIEIQNVGHGAGYPDFPEPQMAALEALSQDIVTRHTIAPERVLAHSDVAPSRKTDPGEKLDWRRLHRAGVGHWVAPAGLAAGDAGVGPGEAGPAVTEMQALLARYGYAIVPTGVVDEQTRLVVTAFQRHFRPARVDGRIDESSIATLDKLIAALPSSRVA